MPSFERRLLDPKPDDVRAAVMEAAEQANYRCRVGKFTPDEADVQSAAADCVTEPEGVRRWLDPEVRAAALAGSVRATLVGLAWGVHPLGSREVLVVGRRLEPGNEGPENNFGPRDEERPAAWLLHPERLFLRTRGGQRELLAVCACEAAGPAPSLGWLGEECAACH